MRRSAEWQIDICCVAAEVKQGKRIENPTAIAWRVRLDAPDIRRPPYLVCCGLLLGLMWRSTKGRSVRIRGDVTERKLNKAKPSSDLRSAAGCGGREASIY
jgi:hypothetical protein